MHIMNAGYRVLLVMAVLMGLASAQQQKGDISSVVAAGTVERDVYRNTYFGISLTAPGAKFEAIPLADEMVAGQSGRLVLIFVYDSPGAMNTFCLFADSLENYPEHMPIDAYVRSVRRLWEKDGLVTHQPEFPIVISGVPFTGAVMELPTVPKSNPFHYRGVYSTFLNGYVLSLEVNSTNEEPLQQLLSTAAVKVTLTGKQVTGQ